MFNEIKFRDHSFKDWRQPIYYQDSHVKEIWYNGHLFYPLGYIYTTRVTGRTNALMAFNFKTRDVYFSGSGDWKLFPFQASVDMTIKTCVKPAGFMPFKSSAHAGVPYSFDTGVATGGVLGVDWAWNYIFHPENVSVATDSNGNITGFLGKARSVDTDHILLGLESAQAHPANSYWDDWDVTRGGWEFNTINDVQVIYNFSGDISEAAGSIRGTGSWSMSSPLWSTPTIDWLQKGKIGESYSSAFNANSGRLLKFGANHRSNTADGLCFEYWLVHDWYPIDNLRNYWSSGKGGLSGVYLRQNGVTGIQVRAYSGDPNDGIGGVYFTIPFQNLVNCNYNYYGEPEIEERAQNNWDEEKFKKLATEKNSSMLYLSPRSGQLPWQRSTIEQDDQFYAKDGKRTTKPGMKDKDAEDAIAKNDLSLLGTLRRKIIELLKTQLGVPHVDEGDFIDEYWHSKVDEYWNCSDLVMWAFNTILNTDFHKNGTYYWNKLLKGELDDIWELVSTPLPGDLIWSINRDGTPSHVCMLVGVNKVIGAMEDGVRETTIDEQIVSNEVYYIRNKLLPQEDEETLDNKLILDDVEIQYGEFNEKTGGSTLYEQRKRANNLYAIQFVSGNNEPLPDNGRILFHIVSDKAIDNKTVNGSTEGNSIANVKGSSYSNRIILNGPSTVLENGEEISVINPIVGTLFIDELPNTFELPATVGYPVMSFILQTGSSKEIEDNLNKITLYPQSNKELASSSILRQEIIRIIKTQLNVPHLAPEYDYGDNWRSKVDEYWNCSDLVMWAYNMVLNTNYNKNCTYYWDKILGGETSEDWEFVDTLLPGDLIWSAISSSENTPSHVCMYIGNNLVIGAEDTGVHITPTENQITSTKVYYVRNKHLTT